MDNIILLLGIVNFLLVLLGVASGMKYIKISFAAHKRAGIILLITAALHGTLAVLAN
jgi:hypothetical protein